jgi:hypothetical protein
VTVEYQEVEVAAPKLVIWCSFLIDVSGSMVGGKLLRTMQYAFKVQRPALSPCVALHVLL